METVVEVEKTAVKKDVDVHVIILNINNDSLATSCPSYARKILGKPMNKWVADAVSKYYTTMVECNKENDIISTILPHLINSSYTAVLYCDTPLLTTKALEEALEYVTVKDIQVCKLERGYIFYTDYLLHAKKIYTPQTYTFNSQDFFAVTSPVAFMQAVEILRMRILHFHLAEGVTFADMNSVTIEPQVRIGKGVVISQNNIITGESIISDNVVLHPNNVLDNAIIFDRACISGSTIRNSIVMEDAVVMPYCSIVNSSIVAKNEEVKSFSNLNNYQGKK